MARQASLSIGTILFTILYLLVHFIPDLGGADVMGAQWLYSSALDLVVLGYIFFNKSTYSEAIQAIYSYKFTLVFSALVIWAMGSYFYALNPTETLVTLARLITTYIIFINVSILFYKQDIEKVFNIVAYIVGFILLYDAIYVLKGFSKNLEEMNLDQNILSLMGNHGNKNVMAASLLIKFPFVLWILIKEKTLSKVFAFFSLLLGVIALFILNTRSTYVGLTIIFIIYLLTTIVFKRSSNKKSILIQIVYFFIPVLIGFIVANTILENAVQIQGFQGGYGSVVKRAGDITIEKEKGSRLHLWEGAIDYATKHLFMGAGYGNWKLASIPYEKEFTNDLFVPYHSHNDFLEMFADLGIVGGLCFGLMFLLFPIYAFTIWRNKNAKAFHLPATISFMAVTCYAVDAFLNFPAERTAMQTMLAISAALVWIPLGHLKSTTLLSKKSWLPMVYLILAISLILPSIYIAKLTYDSLKVQKYVMGEIDADPKMDLNEVKEGLPSIPNLSTSTLPIPALIARYEFRDKHYDEALRLLRESDNVNPSLHYNDFIRTAVFAAQQKFDSVSYYAKRAFYNWPRATSYYKNVIFAAAKQKDTVEIQKAFNLYNKYRPSGEAWNQYLLGMYEVKNGTDAHLNSLLDSAIKTYPADSALFKNVISVFARSGNLALKNTVIVDYAAQGTQAFMKGNYTKAAQSYIKAIASDPNNYTHYENAGICYYTAKDFKNAVIYFDKAIKFPTANTGKSEFFMAMSFIALNNKPKACESLYAAKSKNYAGVDTYISQNCK
ncbi:MAG: O-antigen ligase family protein [Sediminibacterium sp.]